MLLASLLLALAPAPDDLDDLRARYDAAETPEGRIEVLDQLGEWYEPGGPEARAVTALVARGLQARSLVVRTHAVGLLETLERETARDALLELATNWRTTSANATLGGPERRPGEDVKQLAERARAERERKTDEIAACRAALIGALARFADDACVVGLVAMQHREPGRQPAPEFDVFDALLTMGTPAASAGALEALELHERALANLAADMKRARERPVAAKPAFWRKSDAEWKAREEQLRKYELQSLERRADAYEAWGADGLKRLQLWASRIGVTDRPADLQPNAWKAWLDEHRAKLPKKPKKPR